MGMPKIEVPKARLKIEINISLSGDFYSIKIDGENVYQEKIHIAVPYNELLRDAVQTVYKICTTNHFHLQDNRPVKGIDSYIETNASEDKQ